MNELPRYVSIEDGAKSGDDDLAHAFRAAFKNSVQAVLRESGCAALRIKLPSTEQCCDCAADSELGRCPKKCQALLDSIEKRRENVLTLAESAYANRQDAVRCLRTLAILMEETGAWVEARDQRRQNIAAAWKRLDKTFLDKPDGGAE